MSEGTPIRKRDPEGEVICQPCRDELNGGGGIDTRICKLCGAMICRHSARKAQVRESRDDEGQWKQEIVCLDWAPCMVRHAQHVIGADANAEHR